MHTKKRQRENFSDFSKQQHEKETLPYRTKENMCMLRCFMTTVGAFDDDAVFIARVHFSTCTIRDYQKRKKLIEKLSTRAENWKLWGRRNL